MDDTSVSTKIEGGNVHGLVGVGHVVIENFYLGVGALPAQPPEEADDGAIPPCPYPGLAYFGPQDSALFFGRETAIERLAAAVTRQPLTALIGASGSGKSSVVLAGLAPLLAARGSWRFSHFRVGTEPDKNPFAALARALVPLLYGDATNQLERGQSLAAHLETGTVSLPYALGECRSRSLGKRILLIADQFEEVLTLVPDAARRRRFIDLLLAGFAGAAAGSEPPDISLVLTLRADFYGMALRHRSLADALQGHVENLGPMTRQELREAIVRPAGAVSFESGLVETLLDEVEMRPASLPLLQFALREMWRRQQGRHMTRASYEEIGGVEGALARRAQAIFDELTAKGENSGQVTLFRRLFTRLVTLGEGAEDTRRVVSRDELGAEAWALAQQLAGEDNRLVVTSAATPDHDTVEVAHEALIRHWPTLADWINRDRTFQSWLRQLAPRVNEWHEHPGDDGTLLRGGALVIAEDWIQRRGEEISDEEQTYIAASTMLRHATRRREQRRHRLAKAAAVVFFVLAVVATAAGVWAFAERDRKVQAVRAIIKTNELVLDLRQEFLIRRMGEDLLGRMLDPVIRGYDQAIQADPAYAAVYTYRGAAYASKGDYDKAIHDHDLAIRLDPQLALAYKNRGIAYKGKGDPDRAIKDYGEAIRLDPTLVAAYAGRGTIYKDKGDYDRAFKDYDEAIRRIRKDALDPKALIAYFVRASAYHERGTIYWNKGDHDHAIRDFDRAIRDWDQTIQLDPKFAFGYCGRGLAYEGKGDHDRAIRDFDQAIQLHSTNIRILYESRGLAYENKGDHDRAIEDYGEAIRLDPNDYSAYWGRGNVFQNKGENDRAIEDYDRAIGLDPEDVTRYWRRGTAFQSKGDTDSAIRDYEQAILVSPKDTVAYKSRFLAYKALGFAYLSKGDYDRAIENYDRAIGLDPKNAQAYNGRGLAYANEHDYDRAIQDYDEAIQLDSKFALAYNNRGFAYVNKSDYDRAVRDFDQAIELDPKFVLAYINRGNAYANKHDYDRTIRDFDQVIELDPKNVAVYIARGVAHLSKRQCDRAIQDFDQAIELDPKNVVAYNGRGGAYLCKGDYDRATVETGRTIELDPKNVQAYNVRGAVYLHKGDYDHAIKESDQAIELDPNNAQAYQNRGIAYFFHDNFKAAAAAFLRANELEVNAYTMIGRYLARQRLGETGAAELAANAARLKSTDWPHPVIELYLEKHSPETLLSVASKVEERCDAQFYGAEWYLLHDDQASSITALQTAVDTCPGPDGSFAAAELKRLTSKANGSAN